MFCCWTAWLNAPIKFFLIFPTSSPISLGKRKDIHTNTYNFLTKYIEVNDELFPWNSVILKLPAAFETWCMANKCYLQQQRPQKTHIMQMPRRNPHEGTQALVWVEACTHHGLWVMYAFHSAWLLSPCPSVSGSFLTCEECPFAQEGWLDAHLQASSGLLLVPVLCILLRVADPNPQNMVLDQVDWFVHTEHEDELHNQAQVQLLDCLLYETQLGELQDHEVLWGLLSAEFFMNSGGLGNDVIHKLHMLNDSRLHRHHEEVLMKVLSSFSPI